MAPSVLATLIVALTSIAFSPVHAVPLVERAAPTVTLDGATFTGAAGLGVEKFLGIPFAKPPWVFHLLSLLLTLGLTYILLFSELETFVFVFLSRSRTLMARSLQLLTDLHVPSKPSSFPSPLV